jgi:hypothetical protein
MSSSTKRIACAVVLTIFAVGTDAGAQGRGRGRDKQDNGGPAASGPARSDASVSVSVVFRDSDRVAFRDYFVRNRIAAESLPPGIAKNVARGKPLPPGIAKKMVPADLLAVGPRVSNDVSFSIVGRAVVALKNGIVIDILADIL